MRAKQDAGRRFYPADIRPGGLAVYRAVPDSANVEPRIVGFVGPAQEIERAIAERPGWRLYVPVTIAGTPEGASFALCRPDVSPKELIDPGPFVTWRRVGRAALKGAARGRRGNCVAPSRS
jgi:hypothetical protein